MDKLDNLKSVIKNMESVLVAFSGGVDSTFLAKVVNDVLGSKSLAVIAKSATYPASELEAAKALADQIGIRYIVIDTDELSSDSFLANNKDRCYHCKSELFGKLVEIAKSEGLAYVVDGSNYDDLSDYRPGSTAASELGVRSPLCEAGITKAEIRQYSKELGLPTWDKPAMACLASRLPHGTSITVDVLERVGRAEDILRRLGLKQVRVRHHGDMARIEVDPADMALLVENRATIVKDLKSLGYSYVTVDLEGYRLSGLN
ncbi:ATP-dependent sacrificial sulfur transferase LarE [Chloroflexota bacterium]